MHKSNFFGPFPSAPEELKEIPEEHTGKEEPAHA